MARKKRRVIFRVSFELPAGASVVEAKEYVEVALKSWKGGMSPDSAIAAVDEDTILVQIPRALR